MCLKSKLTGLLTAFLILFCTTAQAQLLLNGLAVHQELGNEQFIGAFYSERLTDGTSSTPIDINNAMRMELKVTNPAGLTSRRFSRLWIEGMAINNPNSLLTAQADNMVKFDGMFQGRLTTNDHIVFDQRPNQGVKISINDVVLGTIADDQFFPMLLRTWIGRVPLSSTFRDNLLKGGNVNSDLLTRYNSIQPSADRTADIESWADPSEAQQVAAVTDTKPTAPKPGITPVPAPVIAAPKVELPDLASKSEPVEAKPEPKPTPTAKPEPKPVRPAARTPVDDEDEDERKPALTAQSLLARQFYVSDLLKKIRTNVTYPRRALDKNQEGSVRISIIIDREGNIKNMTWLEESEHSTLNKEAWRAISRSAPFPAMPAAIPGSGFEFSAPITFALPK